MRNLRQAVKLVIDSYSGTVTGQIMTDLRTAGQFIHNDIGTGDAETNLVDLAIQVYADYIDTPTGQRIADEISALAKILAEYEITPTGQRITDIVNLCKAIVNEGWVGFFSNKHYLNFDGVDDYVSLDSEVTLLAAGSSVALWCKLDTGTTPRRPMLGRSTDNYKNYLNVDGIYIILEADNTTYWTLAPASAITDGEYHLIVVTADGGTIKTFIDDMTTPVDTRSNDSNVKLDMIGRGGSIFFWEGVLDEVVMSTTRAFSETDRILLKGGGTPETCGDASEIEGVNHYWDMEEGEETIIADSVGDNDGTLLNGVQWGEH
ncbi:MAG: hypothetical protein HN952_06180 [Candidatus Cloacimonetes bacterium]|nr:hypothetical protein [Candidatus Cloacimonadota bacterium]